MAREGPPVLAAHINTGAAVGSSATRRSVWRTVSCTVKTSTKPSLASRTLHRSRRGSLRQQPPSTGRAREARPDMQGVRRVRLRSGQRQGGPRLRRKPLADGTDEAGVSDVKNKRKRRRCRPTTTCCLPRALNTRDLIVCLTSF